jgi:hypothetical protein
MARGIFTFTHLTPEQDRLLKEAEESLGGQVLLAFTDDEVRPSDLSESQLECIQGLEEQLGMTILAVDKE